MFLDDSANAGDEEVLAIGFWNNTKDVVKSEIEEKNIRFLGLM